MTVKEFYDVFDFEEVVTLAIDFKTKGYVKICLEDLAVVEAFSDVVVEKVVPKYAQNEIVLIPKIEQFLVREQPAKLEVLR